MSGVGSADTANLALSALRKGGKLILVGLFGGEIPLSIAGTILRAITVQGSHLGSVEELKAVVTLAREGKIKPIADVIAHGTGDHDSAGLGNAF